MVKGYKVFRPDWTCCPGTDAKQYSCPGKFEENVVLDMCSAGMHFCKKAVDCFNYYSFNPENKVAEVIAYGNVLEEGDKCCTDKLEIVREIPWSELLDLVNTGKGCSGFCNSGNRNSGDCNSGNRNSGNRNSGDCNSGNRNSGDCNSGDWNKTSFSNGCFNTVEPKIYLFNKPSEWTYRDWLNSRARRILNKIPAEILEWIWLSDMTDEEKQLHPEAEITNGYLKVLDTSNCNLIWWRGLSAAEKLEIMRMPNFDKAIFKEITGIDISED